MSEGKGGQELWEWSMSAVLNGMVSVGLMELMVKQTRGEVGGHVPGEGTATATALT